MKVSVINLERDIEKRKRAEDILTRNNVEYLIFPAIYGKDLPKDYMLSIKEVSISFYKKKGRCLNPGEIGLYLSHIKLLQWFINSDLNIICVLEDDFELDLNFKKCIDEIEEKKDFFNFEILMIGHFLQRKDKGISGFLKNVKKGNILSVKTPLEPNYGTHAYVITREGAKKIINKFSEPLCPIDQILGVSEMFGISRKITSKPIVFQSNLFESSIQKQNFINQFLILFYIKRLFKIILYNLMPSIAIQRMKIYVNQNI